MAEQFFVNFPILNLIELWLSGLELLHLCRQTDVGMYMHLRMYDDFIRILVHLWYDNKHGTSLFF
jgi:hypothetical protein